jgi:hypothetical protein
MKKSDASAVKKSVRIICEDDTGHQGKVALKEKDQQQHRKPLASPPPASQDGKPRRKSSLEIVHKLPKGTLPAAAATATTAASPAAAETKSDISKVSAQDAVGKVVVDSKEEGGVQIESDADISTAAVQAAGDSPAIGITDATAATTSAAADDSGEVSNNDVDVTSTAAILETASSLLVNNSSKPTGLTEVIDDSNISTATISKSAEALTNEIEVSGDNDAPANECATSTLPAVDEGIVDAKADAIVAATATVTPKRPSVGQEVLAKRNTFANFSRTLKPR